MGRGAAGRLDFGREAMSSGFPEGMRWRDPGNPRRRQRFCPGWELPPHRQFTSFMVGTTTVYLVVFMACTSFLN